MSARELTGVEEERTGQHGKEVPVCDRSFTVTERTAAETRDD